MKDINFDELDKAVSSVLGKAESTDSSPTEEQASQDGGVAESSSASKSAIVPQKRRGQFMDVVHPSSDMTTGPGVRTRISAAVPPIARRSQPAIKPLSPDIIKPGESAEPTEPDSMPPVDRSELSGHVDEDDLLNNLAEGDESGVSRAAEVAQAENILEGEEIPLEPKTEDIETVVENTSDVKNNTSPFLESSEVEKRPLGAFSDSSEANSVPAPSEGFEMAQDSAEVDGTLDGQVETEIEEPVPNELHPDVVSVEADLAGQDDEMDNEPADGGRAQSIPQQYRVSEDSSDSEEHAVFDTKQYHPPLDPPAKQKSHKVFYIVMSILMVLVGSVAGYLIWVLKIF